MQEITLGQDVFVSVNSKELAKFKVVKSDNGLISLAAHNIGEDDVYLITIKLIEPKPKGYRLDII